MPKALSLRVIRLAPDYVAISDSLMAKHLRLLRCARNDRILLSIPSFGTASEFLTPRPRQRIKKPASSDCRINLSQEVEEALVFCLVFFLYLAI